MPNKVVNQLPFKFHNHQAQRNIERGIRPGATEQPFGEKSVLKVQEAHQTSLRLQADHTAATTILGQSSRTLFEDDDESMTYEVGSFDKGKAPVAHHNHILLSTQLDSITSFMANSSVDLSQDLGSKAFDQNLRINESGVSA